MINSVSSQTTALVPLASPVEQNPGTPIPSAATAVTPIQESSTDTQLQQRWPDKREPVPGMVNTLDDTLDQINNSLRAWSTGIRFKMDDEAQRLVVSIVDNSTGEVLRTVPSDAVIQIAKMIVQLQGNQVSVKA
ncbi:flagellar protein FlaG [Alcaligenes faecalis]|uniref:flagellar protein FlaG n=1 Tax=Alcaligenes TaxID=507 RepID=UPI002040C438|nr:flagellar protein FlaG [Alcaligenes faecalis]MCM2558064.1 flagellar protein FlaG [Alcaligenes faecalis]MCM2621000.1 flagellar protein FlaG [Alcaligenes faecalis]MDK7587378.1 flagellar protein FlaG [Alcaligenes phenolicus]